MHRSHHGADQTLDMSAVVRATNRTMNEGNSMFCCAANESLAVKLAGVVEMNDIRKAMGRPLGLDVPIFEPRCLRQDQLLDDERNGRR